MKKITTQSILYKFTGLVSASLAKMFGIITAIFLLTIVSINGSYAACQSGFTWYQSANNTIDFTNTSTGASSPTYYWHFGDGHTDHVANPTNIYAVPGTYWVCLTVYDSLHACSTFCDSVTVTGNHNCNLTITPTITNATCATCADGSASVSPSGGTPPYTYYWSNATTSHYLGGLLPGSYSVCVSDAGGCHACTTILIGNHQSSGTCHASFSLHPDTANIHHYWAYNTATGTPPFTYLWSWGDGTYDSIAYPGHGYAASGTYTICLQITDAHGCSDSTCNTQFLHSLASSSMTSVDVIDAPAATVGIMDNNQDSNLKIYPNPFSSQTDVIFSKEQTNTTIKITDILGKEIKTINFSGKQFTIEKGTMQTGIYFVQITDANKNVVNRKVVVQ